RRRVHGLLLQIVALAGPRLDLQGLARAIAEKAIRALAVAEELDHLASAAWIVLVFDDAALDLRVLLLPRADEGVADRRQTELQRVHHLLAVERVDHRPPELQVRDDGRA